MLVEDLGATWTQITQDTNLFTGRLTNPNGVDVKVGSFTGSNMKFVKLNSLLRFVPPEGYHFLDGKAVLGQPDYRGGSSYKWVKVISVTGDGTELQEDGTGAIVFNDSIPTGSKLVEIKTALPTVLTSDVQAQVTDQVFAYKTFGLRYDRDEGEWRVVTENNLNSSKLFSTGKTGDTTNQQLDASWLLKFTTDGEKYTITYRAMRFVFESDAEIRFYYDSSDKIYNNKTGKIVKDKISVLNINTQPDDVSAFNYAFDWEIIEEYRDAEGYVDSKKIQVSFFDGDDDGVVDNPEIFTEIVNETINPTEKLVFLQKYTTRDGVDDFVYTSKTKLNVKVLAKKEDIGSLSQYDDGQLFYFIQEDIFQVLNLTTSELVLNSNYKAYTGRANLKFHYVHVADSNYRIDPSASNIIDTYLLTKNYDIDMRKYVANATSIKPLPASNDQLFRAYSADINAVKSISDEIIYHPVKYKILFGSKARSDLQVKFKIVRNKDLVVNENELKADIINAINRFFAIDNWDFGETFYFQELSAFIMNALTPKLVSMIIVPRQGSQSFGSLFEIKSELDEIFISAAQVTDIEIIDEITATELQASGDVITSVSSVTTGITSATTTTNSSGGGYSY